jgi:hypothetical protein
MLALMALLALLVLTLTRMVVEYAACVLYDIKIKYLGV